MACPAACEGRGVRTHTTTVQCSMLGILRDTVSKSSVAQGEKLQPPVGGDEFMIAIERSQTVSPSCKTARIALAAFTRRRSNAETTLHDKIGGGGGGTIPPSAHATNHTGVRTATASPTHNSKGVRGWKGAIEANLGIDGDRQFVVMPRCPR